MSSSKCGEILDNILQGMNYSEQTGSSEYGNGMKNFNATIAKELQKQHYISVALAQIQSSVLNLASQQFKVALSSSLASNSVKIVKYLKA